MKNIPVSKVVSAQPRVLPEGHEDLLFLNPNDVLIGSANGYSLSKLLSSYPSAGPDLLDPLNSPNLIGDIPVYVAPDVPDLTDIESITYEQYFDEATKTAKIKAVLKIRNSSITKDNVQGVDARIFNPNA